MSMNILIMILALIVAIRSSDWFLGAAESIGVRLRLPAFVLGVLLVGFGTSLPELTTSLAAIADGANDIALANVVGSNIANIFLILGVATFVLGTITYKKDLIDLDLPLVLGVSILFGILVSDGVLTRADGLLLLIGFVGYVLYALFYKEEAAYHRGLVSLVRSLARDLDSQGHQKSDVSGSLLMSSVVAVASLSLLTVSSALAVDRLIIVAENVDIGRGVIAFFGLSLGTSLPELLVSLRAIRKGQGDVAVGNVIGSSVFNLLMVGGLAAVISPQVLDPELVVWGLAGMFVATTMLVVSGITKRIHIWEGLIFILIYLALVDKLI